MTITNVSFNSNASAAAFGWDFQINAAIILMLENIQDAKYVRVEGETEDIEIKLADNKCYYSQAKSVVRSGDVRNVRSKLSSALKTLNVASSKKDCEKLIYITNSPNPFNDIGTMNCFYGRTKRKYSDLPDQCQDIIDNIIVGFNPCHFDKSKFSIYVFPFETDDRSERYKEIKRTIEEFLFNLSDDTRGMAQNIMEIWQNVLFENSTTRDTSLIVKKEDLVWPIIVKRLERLSASEIPDDVDEADIIRIMTKYKDFINNKVERFEFATKILTNYKEYSDNYSGISSERVKSFVNEKWEEYIEDFRGYKIEPFIREKLIKITINIIIKHKYFISDIRKQVKL